MPISVANGTRIDIYMGFRLLISSSDGTHLCRNNLANTKHFFIFAQRRPNVLDVGPTLLLKCLCVSVNQYSDNLIVSLFCLF